MAIIKIVNSKINHLFTSFYLLLTSSSVSDFALWK